jgi:hypothetical protein
MIVNVVVVLMIMMVRFVVLVIITGLRRRTKSSCDTERDKSDQSSFHFSVVSQ